MNHPIPPSKPRLRHRQWQPLYPSIPLTPNFTQTAEEKKIPNLIDRGGEKRQDEEIDSPALSNIEAYVGDVQK